MTLAESLDGQVVRLFHEGQYAEAEPLALQALAVSLKKNGPDHTSTATSLHNLAGLYKTQGKYDLSGPWRSVRKPLACDPYCAHGLLVQPPSGCYINTFERPEPYRGQMPCAALEPTNARFVRSHN